MRHGLQNSEAIRLMKSNLMSLHYTASADL
jgi:hypothetical protein